MGAETKDPVEIMVAAVVELSGRHNARIREEQRSALAALRAAGLMDEGWRTIDSAPKDGTRVIVWPWFDGEPGEARWAKHIRIPSRWESAFGYFPHKVTPTHWRPLPAAPAAPSSPEGSSDG